MPRYTASVVRNINAYTLGARSVNPKVHTKVIWINSWFDPGKEKQAAETLIGQGADVLLQNTDSSATLATAEEKHVHAFGWDSNMKKFGPHAHLGSVVAHWGVYYNDVIQQVLDGKWKSDDTWDGLDKGMVVMAPYTNMPDDVKKLAEDTQAAITSGKLQPFKCPVMDQDGKEVECKGGDHLADEHADPPPARRAYRRSWRCLHSTHRVARGNASSRAFPIGLPHDSHTPYVPASIRASACSVCSSSSRVLWVSASSCSRSYSLLLASASSSPASDTVSPRRWICDSA